jgi:uncharacterized protein (TIGR00369 family)
LNDRFETAPISQLIGMQVDAGEAGSATVRLPITSQLHNPMGRVHGGVYAVLADAAMGIAFGRTLDEGQDFATLDLHVHFIRAARTELMIAKATVRQRGLKVGFCECDIIDDRQRLLATATCCCTVLSEDL